MTTASDLEDVALDPERIGVLIDRPLVAVTIDDATGPGRLDGSSPGLPAVVVGVARPGTVGSASPDPGAAADFDILLTGTPNPPAPWVWCADVAATVDHLTARAVANPTAAVALVQLLRLSARLDVASGLLAESFVYGLLQAGAEHRHWLAGRPPRRPRPNGRAVVLERRGSRLTVELHRPAVHNAFNTQLRDELVGAFELAAADLTIDQVRVTGAGPSFCSGGDLDEFGTADDPSQAHMVRTTRSAARSLLACAARTVFAVHGACVGAGVELAALARRVDADPGATFLLPEVAMGLVPGAGGTATLTARIGRHRTAYLALSGLPLDAATALRWGLVDEIVPRTVTRDMSP